VWPRSFLVAAASLGAASLLAAPVDAGGTAGTDGQASFAVKPVLYDPALPATKSYFIVQAKPGDVIEDKVRVVNTGTASGAAYLYPVDATTGQTSGAVYESRTSPRRDVGGWVRLSRQEVTLAPGGNAVIAFTIRVPAAVRTGDHLGGIVAENSEIQGGSGRGALRIRIKHLTIAAVEVQVPGRVVSRVAVTGVKPGGHQGWQYVYVQMRNPGTVMVKPQGRIVIRTAQGRLVAARKLELDTFVARTAIDYPVLLPRKTLAPGRYLATVEIGSSDRGIAGYRPGPSPAFSTTRTFAFTVSSTEQKQVFSGVAPVAAPPTAKSKTKDDGVTTMLVGVALAAAALLLVLLALYLVRRRRSHRSGDGAATETAGGATGNAAAVARPLERKR
jgi:WxL interacting protein linking bacterial and host surfaces